ncbi:arylamine N-acetyltransferase [soil metagenome]
MTREVLRAEPVRGADREQVAAYLSRIGLSRTGLTGFTEPDLATLTAIVAAHVRVIPFENLTPLMGVPIHDLGVDALFAKLVQRARGGYCFETNNLLRYVLIGMGYRVEAFGARVVWSSPDGLQGPPTAQTHQLLRVGVPGDGQRYLVDVGFGGQTPSSPIRFEVDLVQQTRHEPYRLTEFGVEFVLEVMIGDRWRPLYVFPDQDRPLIDFQVASWYVSSNPALRWLNELVVSSVTDDARWNLHGRHLTVHHRDGRSEHHELKNATAVLDVLMNRFGIDVGGLGDVHKRITESLTP